MKDQKEKAEKELSERKGLCLRCIKAHISGDLRANKRLNGELVCDDCYKNSVWDAMFKMINRIMEKERFDSKQCDRCNNKWEDCVCYVTGIWVERAEMLRIGTDYIEQYNIGTKKLNRCEYCGRPYWKCICRFPKEEWITSYKLIEEKDIKDGIEVISKWKGDMGSWMKRKVAESVKQKTDITKELLEEIKKYGDELTKKD